MDIAVCPRCGTMQRIEIDYLVKSGLQKFVCKASDCQMVSVVKMEAGSKIGKLVPVGSVK
jgi:transposase-like protein